MDFSGGTLVEYVPGTGIDEELARATVVTVRHSGKEFWVETDSEFANYYANLQYCPGYVQIFSHGVYYLNAGPLMGNFYALAPKGVEVAKPEARILQVCYN